MRKTLFCIGALAAAIPHMARAETSDSEAALIGAVIGELIANKTTLGANAGEIEGMMLAVPLLTSAASKLNEEIKSAGLQPSDKNILLLEAESINLSLPGTIRTQINLFTEEFKAYCSGATDEQPGVRLLPNFSDNVDTAIAAAITAGPDVNTEIRSYTYKPSEQMLANILKSQLIGNWGRLEDVLAISPEAPLLTDWKVLRDTRKNREKACEATPRGKLVLSRFDDLDVKYSKPGDKGEPSLIEHATRIDALMKGEAKVLRVHVEKAGGSIINETNLLTRLGLPAVRVSGAAIIGFRLFNPANGEVLGSGKNRISGMLVCSTPRKTLGAVQARKLGGTSQEYCERF